MKLRYFSMIGTVTAFAAAGTLLVPTAAPALSAEVEADEDVQVLTRGPVHEAFAESVSSQPEPGLIVTSAPPEAIEELPPEQQLEGDNVTWVAGYWAWDDDRNDFLWISGIWRNLPPGRQWVPGYWSALDDGRHQWTSGYWADSETTEVEYIPDAPPQSVDVGPNIEAPSEDHTWIPGNWVWGESRYAWRPGYWTPQRQNWAWVPSRYCWSPRGYNYVDGYWDYAVANRGILFAPVYFNRHVYSEPSYYYTPSVVVSLSVFSDHLFFRPRSCHYYFGDYYAPRYSSLGFFASHSWHNRRGCYDPIYAYNRWENRHDGGWDRRQRDRFDFYRDNEDARPLHNWAAMRDFRGDRFSNDERGRNRQFANSFAGFAKNPTGGQRFRNLDRDARQQFVAQNREVRNLGQQRRQLETRKAASGEGAGRMALREKLGRSPVVGRQAERFAKNEAPPKRPEARGTNIRLNPKQQQPGAARGNDAATRPGRQGGLAQRDVNRDPAAKGQARENRKPVSPGAANRNTERDPAAKGQGRADRNPATPGIAKRDNTPKPQARQLPGRKADTVPQRQANRELPGRRNDATPQRQAQPKPQVRQTPQPRKQQVAPQRQTQPKAQSREMPQRRPQAAPQRQAQPKQQVRPAPQQRKQQAAPQRQSQPRPQARQAPQRKAQAAPQRQSQPRPQARQAPQRQPQQAQRQAQPRPQARQAPQRQAQPRQQARPQPQQRQAQPRQQQQARPQPQQRQQRQAPQQREERKKNRGDA